MMKARAVLAGAVLMGSLWVMGGTAHAQLPCPEGMSIGTSVNFTWGAVENPTLAGTPSGHGVSCVANKDGQGILVGFRAAGAVDDEGEAADAGDTERTPCNPHDWRYIYFEGGYFYCSKDGVMTYFLNA